MSRRFGYDKEITRMARAGKTRVIMFGRVWQLERGYLYHVKLDRVDVRDSKIQRMPDPTYRPSVA